MLSICALAVRQPQYEFIEREKYILSAIKVARRLVRPSGKYRSTNNPSNQLACLKFSFKLILCFCSFTDVKVGFVLRLCKL